MVETINEEVLKLFRTLHVYVYMHGSAGTNGLFLPNGSSVVEIMPFAAQVKLNCFFLTQLKNEFILNSELFFFW